MAEYKRKRRGALKPIPKMKGKPVKKEELIKEAEVIAKNQTDTPKKQQQRKQEQQKQMRVVQGKKLKLQQQFKTTAITISAVVLLVILLEILLPAGIFETIANGFTLIGKGGYPISLESSATNNVISKGSYYYLLTNNSIEGYSAAGKKTFSYAHGFEKPVLKTSNKRALVFEQGGKRALIFTIRGLDKTIEAEEKIKNGAIGDDGSYAFITSATGYTAQVCVYEENGEKVYTWLSAKELVNNVGVAPSGKKIAVSTVTSSVGTYNSKVLVFNFKSSSPEYEKSYEDTVVYAIDTAFNSGFSVLTANEYNFIRWSNFKISQYTNEYNTSMIRVGNNGVAVLYNRENDKTDNRIAIFSKNGKLKREIKFKGLINDFALKNNHIYCVSDTNAYILSNDGSFMRKGECGFGVVRVCPIGQNSMAIFTDNSIDKIKLE
jgi:hypothetical protein